MKKIIIETIGWYGTSAILLAYFLISFEFLDSQSLVYQLLNFTGAASVGLTVFIKKAWQALTLEVVWALVAFIAIVRIFLG